MAAAGFLLVFVTLYVRVFWLQVPLHECFEARAERNQSNACSSPRARDILDRNGRPLAR